MRTGLLVLLSAVASAACSGSVEGTGTESPGSGATGGSNAAAAGGSTSSSGGSSQSSGGTGNSAAAGGSGNAAGNATGGTTAVGSGGTGAAPASCAGAAPDTGASVMRRLSNLEYQLTLKSLFRLETAPDLEGIPADSLKDGFEIAETQAVSALHLRGYLDKASELASELLADTTRRSAIIGCDLAAPTCLGSFVTSFGRLAYRRPLETAEVDAITAAATENATDAEDRFRYALEVMLTSPNFLFRVEIGAQPDGLSPLGGYELASRLSFALTGQTPSAALLDAAAAGTLDNEAGLAEAAAELLADPASHSFFAGFFRRWLGYETLRAPLTPPAGWTDSLLVDMQSETDRLLQDYAFGDRNFLEVLTTSSTRLTPALARFYGLPAPAADGLLEIPADNVRAGTGLLTHASLLSAKRDGDLIAVRGNWVRNAFLCDHMEPVDLTAATEDLEGLTRVEIVQVRNQRPDCNGCHALIDPIGVGFDSFDATGRYDESLDPSIYGIATAIPGVDGGEFATVAELSAKLSALPELTSCLTERAFLFVNGREPADADACAVSQVSAGFTAENHGFQALLAALVESPAFRLRRAPSP